MFGPAHVPSSPGCSEDLFRMLEDVNEKTAAPDQRQNLNRHVISLTRIRRAERGAIEGALAVLPMTVVFWVARAGRLIDEVPPHKAIRSVTKHLREPRLSLVSGVAHILVGAAAGAIFGVVVPRERQGPLTGLLFGLGVWVAGYEVVMPSATDIAPAHRDRRRRALVIFAAHVVFGTVLGMSGRFSM